MIQEGDWVRITGQFTDSRRHNFQIGSICKVLSTRSSSRLFSGCFLLEGSVRGWSACDGLEATQYVLPTDMKKID